MRNAGIVFNCVIGTLFFFLATSQPIFSNCCFPKYLKNHKNWAWRIAYAAKVSLHTYERGHVRQTFFFLSLLHHFMFRVEIKIIFAYSLVPNPTANTCSGVLQSGQN